MTNLTSRQLRQAATIQDKIIRLRKTLSLLLGSKSQTPDTRKRRRMSAAGRARIAAAQRARWAKIRKTHK